jgi:hypothetical protein
MSIFFLTYVYYRDTQTDSKVIGEAFIDSEIPAQDSFPFFLKPVTWLMIFTISGWLSFLELVKNKIRSLGLNWRFLYVLLLFLIASLTFYEIMYNFMLWGSTLSRQAAQQANPDEAINSFPAERYQISLVFATKIGVLIFVCSLYALYVFREKAASNRH